MKIIRHPLFMRPTPESELELAIDRELRRLPGRPAPVTLVPRVLEAIARRQNLPWWQKSFAFWPWPARVLFLAGTSGLAAFLIYFTWGITSGLSVGSLTHELEPILARFDSVWNLAGTFGRAVLLLLRSAGPWLLWGTVGVLGACYLTTMALGTFCWRLASRRL